MATLIIEVEGRTLRFDSARVIRIGRSIEADVVLTAGSVSRQHAELRPVGDGWALVDTGSQYGTFVDGDRVREHRVTGRSSVQCGAEARGSSFTVTPEVGAAAVHPVARPPQPAPPVGGSDQTQVLAAFAPGPPAAAFPGQRPGQAPPRTGPDLLVTAEGREYRFRHPATIRVGRQPDSDIVIGDPVCSRAHALISAVPGGWSYSNRSSEGSFDEGRRVDNRTFDERLDLRLGHPVAGPAVSLVPILSAAEEERRFARRRLRRTLLAVGAAIAVLALVGATITAAVVLSRDEVATAGAGTSGSQANTVGSGTGTTSGVDSMAVLTSDELDGAKTATVLLIGKTRDNTGPVTYSGSGSILTSDGLILTNAHVAQPSADGLDQYYGDDDGLQDPDYLLVALVSGDGDSPASPSYRARLVEADGFRDVAVVRIYATADGDPVDASSLDLPTMPIGDSDALESGDDVTILGFPGISGSAHLSITKGVISTFIDRSDLGPRSEIDTDARIAPGNSGGAAINNDAEIIGIPSSLYSEGGGSPVVSGRIRPINIVMDLIRNAEGS